MLKLVPYLITGAVLTLFALQVLDIAPVYLTTGSSRAAPLLVVVGISFFAGFAFAILAVIRKTTPAAIWKTIHDGGGQAEETVEETVEETTSGNTAGHRSRRPPEREPGAREIPEENVERPEVKVESRPEEKVESRRESMTANGLDEGETDGTAIPVENLACGITNALGEGVEAVVDTGISAGSRLAKGLRNGAGAAVTATIYGFARALGIADKPTFVEIREKTDAH